MFSDKVQVKVKAGRGGDGMVSFRHEKYIDRGGPDGGDGGKGGNVVFEADPNLNSLGVFRHKQLLKAEHGQSGSKRKRHGKSGKDIVIKVPLGTTVNHEGELIADIVRPNQREIIARGGDGGYGNAHFKSSVRQAPRVAEKGEKGDEKVLDLELKLIADVGLVGLPNAGKSTFLSVATNAKPEIANYPFTTLSPNLGVAYLDGASLLIADIPGLIEGAYKGKGLGDEFLRHVERTAVLVHLVDAYSEDIAKDYKTISNELKSYKVDLSKRPRIVALSKIDGLDDEQLADQLKKLKKVAGEKQVYMISSHTKEGVDALLKEAIEKVTEYRQEEAEETEDSDHVVLELDLSDRWEIVETDNGFMLKGRKIEKFAARTDFDNEFGQKRLRDIMRKMGIIHALERKGIKSGDKVYFKGTDRFIQL